MTPSEPVAIGLKLEELKRPEAEERQIEGQARGREARWSGSVPGSRPSGREPEKNVTRKEVAEALGMSATQYQRAKTVITAAENPALPDLVANVIGE